MEIQFKWERQEQRFARGENLMVGKWCVGSISPDVVKSEYGNMCVYTDLPGLKKRLKNQPTTELAKAALERAVTYWFRQANVKTNPGDHQ